MAKNEMPVEVTLLVSNVFVAQENKTMVRVYCPELDMWGVGDSRKEAEDQFEGNLKMNLEMAKAQGLLKDILLSFGWTVKDGHWSPPEVQVEKTTVTL